MLSWNTDKQGLLCWSTVVHYGQKVKMRFSIVCVSIQKYKVFLVENSSSLEWHIDIYTEFQHLRKTSISFKESHKKGQFLQLCQSKIGLAIFQNTPATFSSIMVLFLHYYSTTSNPLQINNAWLDWQVYNKEGCFPL